MSTPDGRAFVRVVIIMVTPPSNANYTASMAGTIANVAQFAASPSCYR